MYKDVLRMLQLLSTAILILLAGKLQDICWAILMEVRNGGR
jgi:hypothetical protein